MKRVLIYGIVIFLLIVFGVVAIFGWMSFQPLYRPGMVSKSAPVAPQQPADSDRWLMETGIELAHFSVGDGENVLVVHGGPGMPFSEPMHGLEPLQDRYRFHYYDQRGSGDSTRPIDAFEDRNTYKNMQTLDAKLGIGAQLADIERIRQILGDEKLTIIGHSWGGFLAALYAAEFPEHVDKVILIAPANMLVMPHPEGDSDLFDAVRNGLPEEQREAYDAFMADYMDFSALFGKSEDDLVAMNDEFARYFESVLEGKDASEKRSGGWMVWAQYVSIGRRHNYTNALQDVVAPVLVIHGTDDFVQTEAASRSYADAMPNAEFVLIDGATHFPFDEQPDRFAEVVEAFLQE